MERRAFLQQTAAASLLNPARAAATRTPNILFVLADQWRPQTLPSSGDRDLIAPNLAEFARQGTHFDRAYVSNPVCTPSRASILTGRFPHACRMPKNDLRLPAEERCIAAELKTAGYWTGYIGKWHLDGEERPGFVPPGPRRRGFDYWAAFNRGHSYFKSEYYRDTPEPIRPGGFEPVYQTTLAIDFIRRNRANPFYLYLSWGPPHTPRTPPPDAPKYDPRQFRLAENVPDEYRPKAREGMAGYYGLCSALDVQFGRLMKALDEEKLADNTLVIFTADHGDMLGAHGLEFKDVPYEESARVPLLMRWPGRLKAGVHDDLLISNVDLMPTLLTLGGAKIPEAVEGRSLASPLFDRKGSRPDSVFSYGKLNTPDEWRMVVRGWDKLVVDQAGKPKLLFNLRKDPFENTNLLAEPGNARTRDEMLAHLREWRKRIGDGLDPSGLRKR
jgi:arylsulfatase A-like enzyme